VRVLLATIVLATSAQVDLRPFVRSVTSIARPTGVPIILPDWLRVEAVPHRLYASAAATRTGWDLKLSSAPDCGHASACFVALFQAERGAALPGRPNATLPGGIPAQYRPVGCGGSCAPATLWFVRRDVLYTFQVESPPRDAQAALLALAVQALRRGPR
jgi:hypothetical protein